MATQLEPQTFTAVLDNTDQKLKQLQAFKNQPISALPQKLMLTGVAVGTVVVVSMMAIHIITGMLAIGAMALTGAGLFVGYYKIKALAPSLQQKSRNESLKRMVEEARKNAVYQLDNEVLSRRAKLSAARKARDDMGGFVETMRSGLAKTDPSSSTFARKEEILNRTNSAYLLMSENLDKVGQSVKQFELQVKDYKDLNEYANMAGDAMAIFNANDDSKLQEMLSLEAFRQIDADFNSGIVSIENAARDMNIDNQ